MASTESGAGEILTASTITRLESLDLEGRISRCGPNRSEALVHSIGALDAESLAVTTDGRDARAVQALTRREQRISGPIPAAPAAGAAAAELEQFARDGVTGAASRQTALPRPSFWPLGAPVLAAPVHSASR